MLGVRYKEALASALEGKATVWYYASDFSGLWSDSFGSDLPIMIVWDRASLGGSDVRDDRLLEPHLTPLDWALSWSMKCVREGKDIPSILIIDTRADQWAGSWAWTVRHQLLADMPWVTLAAPFVRKDGARELYEWVIAPQTLDGVENKEGVIQFVDAHWGVVMGQTLWRASATQANALTALSQIWKASLLRSDEHHDINNIVGAKLLLERVGDKLESDAIRALLKKVNWVGEQSNVRDAWQPWESSWPKDYLYDNDLIVTLYDDMHEALWFEFLQQFLDNLAFNGGAEERPDELIEFLTKRAVFDRRDFVQNAHEPSNGTPEIIFLDLRLYGDEIRDQFLANTRTLLAKAAEIVDCRTLAWSDIGLEGSPISSKEISGITEWLDRGGKAGDHFVDQALLLLPRLLALALPLTPIILFSSTAQASVREKLKIYRNIFTGFQKPNPLGDPSSINSATDALSTALDLAMPMLRRRMQLAYCQKISSEMERKRPVERMSKHVEIYFDESGYQGFDENNIKGSLFSTAAVIQFDDIKDADMVCSELRKAASLSRGNVLCKGTDLEKDSIKAELDRLNSIIGAKARKVDILSVMCDDSCDALQDLSDTSLSAFADAALDEAISHNIFYTLFCFSEYYCNSPTIFINIPTRRPVVEGVNRRVDFEHRFAIYNAGGGERGKSETYNKYAGFPLVRGWLQSWGKGYHSKARKIKGILTKSISSNKPLEELHQGRSLHYIADWAAGFVGIHGNVKHWKTRTILRPALGNKLFKSLHYSHAQSGNILPLAETLRLIVSVEKPELAQAVNLLCQVPLVHSAGNQSLPEVWQSMPQEHLWLWAIFPHIANKATGDDLFCGL